MAAKGAGNIVLTSRSAEKHPDVAALVESVAQEGSKLVVRNCDISDANSVAQLAKSCADTLPPIRGVVVAAMVLDVSALMN